MSSTDPQDTPAAPPSTELELRQEVDELRAALVEMRSAPTAPVPARAVPRSLDEWVLVVRDYNLLAQSLAKTSFVPKDFHGKPDQITATMMYGREIGLPPMTTLQNTYVVHGRVGMYAEQLRAMILEAGHEIDIEEMTSDRCVVSGKRKGSDRWQRFEFTMDMAKAAGLYAANDNYRKRPAQQLFARASALLAHAMFPDVIRGMGSLEELEDEGQGAVDAPPVQATTEKVTRTVGRAAKKTAPALKAAPGPQLADEVVIPDETLPPLPGEVEAPLAREESPSSPAGSTPGEGRTTEPSTPAGPTDDAGGAPPVDASPDPANSTPPASPAGTPRCPVISMGVQCRYQRHDESTPHTFGGGMGDPVDLRRCADHTPHVAHAYVDAQEKTWACSGAQEPAPRLGERHCPVFDPHSAHVWTDSDEGLDWTCIGVVPATDTGAGPVQDKPRTISPGTLRTLQARFKSLGYTDEPDDRETRLKVAAVLGDVPGSTLDSFKDLTQDQASQVLTVLGPLKDRGDVLELMVRASKPEDGA